MRNKKPWGFCQTPEEKCTMNYCDENGCVNRKRDNVVNFEEKINLDIEALMVSKFTDIYLNDKK